MRPVDFGRGLGGNRGVGGFLSNLPPVMRFLLISNFGLYLLQLLFGSLTINTVPLTRYIEYYGYLWPIGTPEFHVWQLFTYMFLHAGLMHVGFNMLVLFFFGVGIEQTWGSKKFLIYYLLCGLGGALAQLLINPLLGFAPAPLVGASGAIMGVVVAFGLLYPDRMMIIFPIFIPMKAKYAVMIMLALDLFMEIQGGDNIGHLAHLGGAVTGMIYMIADVGGAGLLRRLRPNSGAVNNPWQSVQTPSQTPSQRPSMFRRPVQRPFQEEEPVEAEYQDIGRSAGGKQVQPRQDATGSRVITQEDIDRILDKIAATGYQNLNQEEREILFEASRKMDGKS